MPVAVATPAPAAVNVAHEAKGRRERKPKGIFDNSPPSGQENNSTVVHTHNVPVTQPQIASVTLQQPTPKLTRSSVSARDRSVQGAKTQAMIPRKETRSASQNNSPQKAPQQKKLGRPTGDALDREALAISKEAEEQGLIPARETRRDKSLVSQNSTSQPVSRSESRKRGKSLHANGTEKELPSAATRPSRADNPAAKRTGATRPLSEEAPTNKRVKFTSQTPPQITASDVTAAAVQPAIRQSSRARAATDTAKDDNSQVTAGPATRQSIHSQPAVNKKDGSDPDSAADTSLLLSRKRKTDVQNGATAPAASPPATRKSRLATRVLPSSSSTPESEDDSDSDEKEPIVPRASARLAQVAATQNARSPSPDPLTTRPRTRSTVTEPVATQRDRSESRGSRRQSGSRSRNQSKEAGRATDKTTLKSRLRAKIGRENATRMKDERDDREERAAQQIARKLQKDILRDQKEAMLPELEELTEILREAVEKVGERIDRSKGPCWDKTTEQLLKLWKKSEILGYMNNFLDKELFRKFKSLLREELMKRGFGTPSNKDIKRMFWRAQAKLETPSHLSHPSMECAQLKALGKGTDNWTEAQLLMIFNFVRIGALCLVHYDPIKLTPEQKTRLGCKCNCPRPEPAMWKTIVVDPSTVPRRMTAKEVQERLWKEQYATLEALFIELLETKLIKVMGKKRFEEKYPYHDKHLLDRDDPFAITAKEKYLELKQEKMDANEPPVFMVSWTDDKSDDKLNMPHQWIGGPCRLSDESEKHYQKTCWRKNGKAKPTKSDCTDCTAPNHTCCGDNSYKVNGKITQDGLFRLKSGLLPCGEDGKGIPRTVLEQDLTAVVCDEYCRCNQDCPKRIVERGPKKMCILFRTYDRGWSMLAAEKFVRGEFIMNFSGFLMTQEEMQDAGQDMSMVMDITGLYGKIDYDVQSGYNRVLTISTCIMGNAFKYFNHDCDPNTVIVKIFSRKYGAVYHQIANFARNTINVLDEITWDYYPADGYFYFDCKCGSEFCRSLKTPTVE